jgi:hypothetical protein
MQTNAINTETMQTNAINTETMQTNATNATNATTTETMQTVEYDFENDDDSFYDFIEFGIASNRGQLCIKRRV